MPNTIVSSDFSTYTEKGLTWISDLPGVHPRDTNGNIILQESGSNNPMLIIEPVKFDFTVESVRKVIETRFNFFQFPVSTVAVGENFNLDTDIGSLDVEPYEQPEQTIPDPITTKYNIPLMVDAAGQLESGYKRVGTSYSSDWFYNDALIMQQGYTRVPFATDNGQGSFEINQIHIDYAKQTNKVILFKIFVQLRSDYIGKGLPTSMRMRLSRTEVYDAWEPWNGSSNQPILYTEDTGTASDNTKTGIFGENDYPGFYLEYIVDPNSAAPGQKYFVEVITGNPSWLLAEYCRWDVIAIERPKTKPIYGNVLNIGTKTRLIDGTNTIIGQYKNDVFEYASARIETQSNNEYLQQLERERQATELRNRKIELLQQIARENITGIDTGAIKILETIDPELAREQLVKRVEINIRKRAARQ